MGNSGTTPKPRRPDGGGAAGAASGGRRPGSQQTLDSDSDSDSPHEAQEEIEESHQEHAENAKITDRQGHKMEERKETIVGHLEDDGFEIREDSIYGSVLQDTATGPLDEDTDVDILVVLDEEEHGEWAKDGNGTRNALRSVKRTLQKKYPNHEVYIDRSVVTVEFSDFKVEVTPAFKYSAANEPEEPGDPATVGGVELPFHPGGRDDPNQGYVIPDTYGEESWVGTNPRKFQSIYETVNNKHNGKLQQVAVTAKKWNEKNGKPVSSFHMVNMAHKYFQEDAPANASTTEHMHRFFRNLPDYMQGETREPVYQERLDRGMSREEKRKAAEKAYSSQEKLREAKKLQDQGKTEEAKEKYREVYGDEFN
jgi:hypothetical protein